jgi:septal ring factor EnvC (AmiA/AmiB activator)
MGTDAHLMLMHGLLRDAGSRMAAAVDAAEECKALGAKIREVEKDLKEATGDERLVIQQRLTALEQRLAALEQRLAALEQQKLLLMQQQSGVSGLAHSQGSGQPSTS